MHVGGLQLRGDPVRAPHGPHPQAHGRPPLQVPSRGLRLCSLAVVASLAAHGPAPRAPAAAAKDAAGSEGRQAGGEAWPAGQAPAATSAPGFGVGRRSRSSRGCRSARAAREYGRSFFWRGREGSGKIPPAPSLLSAYILRLTGVLLWRSGGPAVGIGLGPSFRCAASGSGTAATAGPRLPRPGGSWEPGVPYPLGAWGARVPCAGGAWGRAHTPPPAWLQPGHAACNGW